MSGGEFDYIQYKIEEQADRLRGRIKQNSTLDGDGFNYSEETIEKFYACEELLRLSAKLLHRIDWLISGDDSEETFHERLKNDLSN